MIYIKVSEALPSYKIAIEQTMKNQGVIANEINGMGTAIGNMGVTVNDMSTDVNNMKIAIIALTNNETMNITCNVMENIVPETPVQSIGKVVAV